MTNPFAGATPAQGGFAAAPAAPAAAAPAGAFVPQAPQPVAGAPAVGAFTAAANAAAAAPDYVPVTAPAVAAFGALPESVQLAAEDKRNIINYAGHVVILKFYGTKKVRPKERPEKLKELVEGEWLVLNAEGAVIEKVVKQAIWASYVVVDAKNAMQQGINVVPALVYSEIEQGNNTAKLTRLTDPAQLEWCRKVAQENGYL